MQRLLFRLVALLLVLMCSACAKPPYWVSGLSLPPGSTVVSETETTDNSDTPMMMPMLGEVERTLMVSFNCSGSWESVVAHIDACMSKAGYIDTMGSISGMASAMPEGEAAAGILDSMRMYTKKDTDYSVNLHNMQAMMDGVNGSAALDMLGMGQYQLMVMKYK